MGLNLASGVLVFSAAGVLNRRANVTTSNLGVNALSYLGPAVSVGLLAASGLLGLAPRGAEVSRRVLFIAVLSVVLLVKHGAGCGGEPPVGTVAGLTRSGG